MPVMRIIMPLPFRKVFTFDGPVWYFDDTACIETIYDEDFSAFSRDELEDFYKAAVKVHTACIYLTEPLGPDPNQFARNTATQTKFVLNAFSADAAIAIPFAGLVEVEGRARIRAIWNLESSTNLYALSKLEFRLKSGIDAATVSEYYKLVRTCCEKHPPLIFTLERFNSALIRESALDRIVDITISLESLISGKDELRFKFALYNSFIAASGPDERFGAFKLLMKLYDARSAIVHGDTISKENSRVIETVADNWPEIVKLARAALNYHLFFVHQAPRDEWDEHLKYLVYAKTNRIVE
jgi:hypothetical protein